MLSYISNGDDVAEEIILNLSAITHIQTDEYGVKVWLISGDWIEIPEETKGELVDAWKKYLNK